jgi:non-ribosomal peptide synthetase component F
MSTPPSSSRLAGLSREQRAQLAEQLRKRKEKEGAGAAPESIPRRPPDLDPIPASFAQERFWFLDCLQPGNPAFNIPTALHLAGEIAPALLEAVFAELVRRHESLRTTFRERGGEPVQVVAPPGRWVLPLVDLAGLPEAARQAETQRLADREAAHAFDLERGPLLRATLLRLAAAEHALLLVMHHIISDGWSMGVLVREIAALSEAVLASGPAALPSALPALPIQYADFAVWQRGWLTGSELERQLAYWRRQLAGAPETLDLPADRPRPAVPAHHGARAASVLGQDLTRELARLARRHDSTLFMVLLAAFQALLGRLSGQADLAVGTPIANRNRAEIEPLIGFFVNTLVLRGDLTGDPSFAAFLARVRRTTLEAYAHQDLPFERLVGELSPERHLAASPLFQVLCALQNVPQGSLRLPGLSLETLDLQNAAAQFDLELNAAESEGSLHVVLTYSSELFDGSTVRRWERSLEGLLLAAVTDDESPVSALPLLGEGERQQLLREWNDTLRTAEPEGAVQRFAAQVARTPDAIALEMALETGGERLTYAELDRRAGRLAHRLRRLGIGPETTVGLFADRSPELVIGLLGIWKAGGAYLPLDPGHPAARLAYMLEDSQVEWLALPARLAGAAPGGLPESRQILIDPPEPDGRGEESDGDAAGLPDPRDLAYRIYTSGTTGRPKAVLVEHGHLASTLAAVQDAFSFHKGDRMPCIASASFDIFLFELLGPLLAGGTVVLFPLRPSLDLERLLGELGTATLLHARGDAPGRRSCTAPRHRGPPPARPLHRRRRRAGRPAGRPSRGLPARVLLGALRTHGDGDRLHRLARLADIGRRAGALAPRPPVPRGRDPDLRSGRGLRARRGAHRRAGGDLDRRCRRGPRLLAAGGADGREIRPRRRPALLPQRRPRAPAAGRHPGVPGARRPAGQGARLPHRAGGDRGRPAAPP